MIVTIFRSWLNPGVQEEYGPMAQHMSELARTIPGYVSHKGFTAEDGERVTIVEFESEEALQEWRLHPEHAKAKRRGIQSFFSDYKSQICTVIRDRVWTLQNRRLSRICRLKRMTGRRVIAPRRNSSAHVHRPWRATQGVGSSRIAER
jgi:heme-degrading monooxygenase HmoA